MWFGGGGDEGGVVVGGICEVLQQHVRGVSKCHVNGSNLHIDAIDHRQQHQLTFL